MLGVQLGVLLLIERRLFRLGLLFYAAQVGKQILEFAVYRVYRLHVAEKSRQVVGR